MLAKASCPICEIKDDTKSMIRETNKKYYHLINCHQEYLRERAEQDIENEQWSKLFEYIKELHGIVTVPSRTIKRLQELRHGNDIKEGKTFKRYRQGISYDLMLEAYIEADEKIRWFIENVLRGGNTPKDINGCITMMLDNGLNKAWQNRQLKEKRLKEQERLIAQTETKDMSLGYEVPAARKKKDNMDITDIL